MVEKNISFDKKMRAARLNALNEHPSPYLAHKHKEHNLQYLSEIKSESAVKPEVQYKIVSVPESLGGLRMEPV